MLHAHGCVLTRPVLSLIECVRRLKLRAPCLPKWLQNASKLRTTQNELENRQEQRQKISEKQPSCKRNCFRLRIVSPFLLSRNLNASRFEILLSVPISNQDVAAEWEIKRNYANAKVSISRALMSAFFTLFAPEHFYPKKHISRSESCCRQSKARLDSRSC